MVDGSRLIKDLKNKDLDEFVSSDDIDFECEKCGFKSDDINKFNISRNGMILYCDKCYNKIYIN